MYHLLTIDLIDTFIHADVYDEERYKTIRSSETIESLISPAVIEFLDRNTWLGNSFTTEKWENEAEDFGTDTMIIDDKGKIYFRGSMIALGDEVVYGLHLAQKYHGGKIRKVDGGEEIIHMLDVAYMIYRNVVHSGVLVSAGFCHDLLEDTDCSESEIKEKCGDKVLRIVNAVTNDPLLNAKDQWENKKKKYIQNVELGGIEPMLVSLVDKIVNLKALKEAYAVHGTSIWGKFNRGKEQKLWFEEEVYSMLKKHTDHVLLKEYRDLIDEMKEMKEF